MGWRLKGRVSCGCFTAKESERAVCVPAYAVHIHQFLIHCPKRKHVYSVEGRIFQSFDGYSRKVTADADNGLYSVNITKGGRGITEYEVRSNKQQFAVVTVISGGEQLPSLS